MGAHPTVLVADDNAANLMVLRKILEKAGYATVVARNGAEAVDAAEGNKPHILLLDIGMPVLNGIEAFEEIKRRDPQATILAVAVTASDTSQMREACDRAGFADFVPKPVRRETIIDVVRALEAELCPQETSSS